VMCIQKGPIFLLVKVGHKECKLDMVGYTAYSSCKFCDEKYGLAWYKRGKERKR